MSRGEITQTGSAASAVRLTEILDEFSERLVKGESPDVESYAGLVPERAEDIRQLLVTMLAVHRATREADEQLADGSPDLRESLGDFRLLREVGRGGMGIVYEAEQLSLSRRVAVKVLPFAAVLDEKHLQRFRNEAHAAAQLHHDHIVPVYAIGCQRGVHYYAMQFIEGQTAASLIENAGQDDAATTRTGAINSDDHVAAASASTVSTPVGRVTTRGSSHGRVREHCRSIAALGVDVARALHHAHECGVVHRDIKPSNLLLDGEGKVWVTDFGLAHIQAAPDITPTGDVMGTFRYMSPEQASGHNRAVDHHTDIYSLGATLYELLTFRPVLAGSGRAELINSLLHDEPRRLRAIDPRIPIDLETIVLKCLSKLPSERYATADDVAQDLQRFLDDLPIKAQRPTIWKRARKWTQRHSGFVAAAAAMILLALIGTSIATAWIWHAKQQTEDALQVAEESYWRAHGFVGDYFVDVSENLLLDEPGMQPLRQRLMQRARDYYLNFAAERQNNPLLTNELYQANLRLGEIAAGSGSPREALAYYGQAETFLRKTPDANPTSSRFIYDLAHVERRRGQQYLNLNDLAEALRWSTMAEQRLSSLIEQQPENVHEYRAARVRALVLRAQVYQKQDRVDELFADLKRAEADARRLLERFPDEDRYRLDLAWVSIETGRALEQMEKAEEALDDYVDAADISREVAASSPNLHSARHYLTLSQQSLGRLLSRSGQPSKALEHLLEAKLTLAGVAAANPTHVDVQSTQANTYRLLANTYQRLHRFDEAQRAYQSGLQVLHRLDDASRQNARVMEVVSGMHRGLGDLFDRQGMPEKAIESLEEARRIQSDVVKQTNSGESIADLANTLHTLAMAYRRQGDHQKAVELGQLACETAEAHLARQPGSVHALGLLGASYNNLGLTYKAMGDLEQAMEEFQRAVVPQTEAVRRLPGNPKYANFLANHFCNLAVVQLRLGQSDESIASYRRAAEVREQAMQRHPDDQGIVIYAALNYLDLGKTQGYCEAYEDARRSFERAIELFDGLSDSTIQQSPEIAKGLQEAHEGLAKLDKIED
jgi:serine/threonine protein kinase